MIRKTYRIKDGQMIKGVLYSAFINNDRYFLTDIAVFADGMIDCWELVDLEGFRKKVRQGWVHTQIPEGAEFSIFRVGMANMKPKLGVGYNEQDFIEEIEDCIAELQNRPTSKTRCREAFEQFLRNPNSSNRDTLEELYEKVPVQNRKPLLGDMDNKDFPIKLAIQHGQELSQDRIQDYLNRYFPGEEEIARQNKLLNELIEKFKRESEEGGAD